MDSPVSRLLDEILAMVFEEVIWQFEIARDDAESERPLPQALISQWDDMPESWMSKWRIETASYNFGTVADSTWKAQATFLMAVTSVSRRWRDVSLRTPRIWRHIIQDDADESYCYSIKVRMGRSGATPLYVHANGLACAQKALGTLVASGGLHRIDHLEVIQYWGEDLLGYLRTAPCPELRSLTFRDLSENIEQGKLVEILQSCPKLRSLNLQEFALFDMGSISAFSLDMLRNLEIVLFSRQDVLEFFVALQADGLERLLLAQYHDSDDTEPLLPSTLKDFTSLRELVVGGNLECLDIMGLLFHMSNLEVLRLFEPALSVVFHSLLRALHSAPQQAPLLTKLRVLSFAQNRSVDRCFWRSHEVSLPLLDALHRLIDSRRSAQVAQIQSVGLWARNLFLAPQPSLKSLALKVNLTEWMPPSWYKRLSE